MTTPADGAPAGPQFDAPPASGNRTPNPADTTPPAAAPDEVARRPHPLTPVLEGWFVVFAFLAWFLSTRMPWNEPERMPPLAIILLAVVGITLLAALIGFLTWYFTTFVINDHEVRIERGWLFRSSKKIAIERIQSIDVHQRFAARMFGLAELKIDAAGDATTLKFLKRDECYAMRDTMLARAHGLEAAGDRPAATLLEKVTDTAVDERTLVTIQPQQLLLAALFSTEVAFVLLGLATVIAVSLVFDIGPLRILAVAGVSLVPALLAIGGMFKSRLFDQFNYRLSTGPRGVKISRGLTSLSSQAVPLNRIQGVRIRQGLLWRPLGLYRVDIDVLGTNVADSASPGNSSSILLPSGNADQVVTALHTVLPNLDLTRIALQPADRGARWFRPWFWHGLRHGHDHEHVVSESGRWGMTADIVPHARVQSVRVTQGPLQRRVGVATAHVDTTPGPVDLDIPHLSLTTAFAFADAELDRSAAARRREDHGESAPPVPPLLPGDDWNIG